MRFLNLLLALLAISGLASAVQCNGTTWGLIPAVMGEDGGVVNVTATLVPGGGHAFIAVYPRVGVATQESAETAFDYAYAKVGGSRRCDVLISFGSRDGAGFIDGPSGGTALAVIDYSLLTGIPMRRDTIITGAIDSRGNVGPVGGLYEKAKSSTRAGAKYFITPTEDLYEFFILKRLEASGGLTVLQAKKVDDVVGFMLENKSLEQTPISESKREIPDVAPYNGTGLDGFAKVAARMIDAENETATSISGADQDSATVRDFFHNEAARQRGILAKGYVFSAANEAFLNYIDLSTIRAIMAGQPDLPRAKGEVGACLSSMPRPGLTGRNFEWVVGADLRKAWAYDKLNNTPTDDNILQDERFVRYNELMYGDAWCNVGKALLGQSPEGGAPINESAWRGLAETKIGKARGLNPQNPDVVSRLHIAQNSYGKGLYGAAIFDAAYVIAMAESDEEQGNAKDTQVLLRQERDSLWGRVYQSHAAFLMSQNETDSAYRTARLAEELDNATAEMVDATAAGVVENATAPVNGSANGTTAPVAPNSPPVQENGDTIVALGGGTMLLFLLIIAIMLWLGRTDGTHGKRIGRAYRAKQKKG